MDEDESYIQGPQKNKTKKKNKQKMADADESQPMSALQSDAPTQVRKGPNLKAR